MRQVLDRMRAAFSLPGAWLIVIALLLVLAFAGMGQESGTSLEARIAKALSAMDGAGRVEVVIRVRETPATGQNGLFSGRGTGTEAVPCGAVAVAEGADDPIVRMQLTQALCALLGLQASAVSVMSASEGGLQ